MPVAVLIGVTVLLAKLVAKAVLPSGVTATASGWVPNEIALPAVLVAVLIGVTVLSTDSRHTRCSHSARRRQPPHGAHRDRVPPVLVAVLIGVTELLPWLTTYAVAPLGVTPSPSGSDPTVIGAPAEFVAVLIGVTYGWRR